MSAFVDIATEILAALVPLKNISATLIGPVFKLVSAGYLFVVLWYAFSIIRGTAGSHIVLDLFAKSFRTFLIIALCTGANSYKDNIEDLISDTRAGLTKSVSIGAGLPGGGGGKPEMAQYKQIDDVMSAAKTARVIIEEWGWDHVGIGFFYIHLFGFVAIILGWFMYLVMLAFGIVACVYLLVIDFSLGIILALGPIFFACAAFEATAKFFDTWLGGVLKYIFSAVVVSCVLILALKVMETFSIKLQAANELVFMQLVVTAVATAGVLLLVLKNAPQIAADMVGGAALSMSGAAQMVKSAAKGSASTAANAAGYAYGQSQRGGSGGNSSGSSGSGGSSSGGGSSGGGRSAAARVVRDLKSLNNFSKALSGNGASSKGFASGISNAVHRGQHGSSKASYNQNNSRPITPIHQY